MKHSVTAVPELTARGRASRDRIIHAATVLMLERGVAATSVDDVLAAAGASKSQLYHYFTSKRDLVEAVIDHAEQAVLGAQQPLLSSLDNWDALRAWCDHIVALKEAHGCELGCPLGTLASELVATDDAARIQLAGALQRWENHLRAGLRRMQEQQLLEPTADVDALATATMASLQGGLLLAKASRSTRPLRIALDAALAHLHAAALTPSRARPSHRRPR
ncbi:MAG: TetR/AcrR family transcriptional regulator [Ilumatobacteraceae bacterium]